MEEHSQPFDICIVCALAEEANAVIHEFSDRCENTQFQQAFSRKNGYAYRYTTLKNSRGELLTVLIICMPFTGPIETALNVKSLLEEFHPRFVAMAGICAGYKEKVALGDLIAASYAFHSDGGKVEARQEGQDILRPEWRTYGPQSRIVQYLQEFITWEPPLVEMKQRLLGRDLQPAERPRCFIAPIASSMAVQGNNPFPRLLEHNRKAIFLDQEVAAFYHALHEHRDVSFLAVKGVCDYADTTKNDDHHEYAARASAIYLLHFIQKYVTDEAMPRKPDLPSSHSRPRNYIPLPRNPLFQPRPGEFEQLEAALFQPRSDKQPLRLGLIGSTGKVGMIGMGGIGKTQLAVQLAYRYEERFPSGVFWATATGLDLLAWQQHLAELALNTEYLPLNDNPSQSDNEYRRASHFCRYLAQHPDVLLILDNVEDPNLLLTALPELAGREMACTILYTSRNRSVLPGIIPHSVERLPEQAALRLLLETTRPALLNEVLSGSTQPESWSAREICRDVDCLPLALVHLRGLLARDQHLTLGFLLDALRKQGALTLARKRYGDAGPLFATFFLSWEKVDSTVASQLFKLATFFPEAIPIPLWLLGLAGGLGENADILGPLREARLLLQELSLFEEMSNDQLRLHPLLREFGRRLVEEEEDYGKKLLLEAAKRLTTEFTSLNKVQERVRHTSYRHCLEEVRAAREYAVLLEASQAIQIERVEKWMDRESYLLEDEAVWPKMLPGLFYQQIYNRAIEEGFHIQDMAPEHWVRLLEQVRTDDTLLLTVFRGHTGSIRSVAFSPNGSQVLTGSLDGTARIWELSSRRLLATLTHTSAVSSVAFSPDSSLVLTGSLNGTARIWEPSSRRLLALLEDHTNTVTSVAFSPNGTQVLTGSGDGTACLWKGTSGEILFRLRGHSASVLSVTFSPDSSQVLTGSVDGTACLWEATTGKLLMQWNVSSDGPRMVSGVAFSADGNYLLTSSYDRITRVWERANRIPIPSTEGPKAEAYLASAPDSSWAPAASDDRAIQLWERFGVFDSPAEVQEPTSGKLVTSMQVEAACGNDCAPREPTSGKLVTSMQGHTEEVLCLTCSPNSSQVLTGSDDKTARLWDLHSGTLLTILQGHTHSVSGVAFSPDGNYMITGSDDQTARLWKSYKGKLSSLDEGHTGRISSMAFSSDGNLLLTGAWDHTARVWERSTGKLLTRLLVQDSIQDPPMVNSVAFAPDATRLIVGSDNNTATIWETGSGKMLASLQHQHQFRKVNSVAFSPDGVHVLTASEVIRLWDSSTYQPILTLPIEASTVGFSPDGLYFFGIGIDSAIYIWERTSGTLLMTLKPPESNIERQAIFSPNGRELLTIGDKGRISLWSINEGRVLRVLLVPAEQVMYMSFSPNGKLIIICDAQGRVFFWRHDTVTEDILFGMYVAPCELGASYWISNNEVILADKGAHPHFHRLKLEGI